MLRCLAQVTPAEPAQHERCKHIQYAANGSPRPSGDCFGTEVVGPRGRVHRDAAFLTPLKQSPHPKKCRSEKGKKPREDLARSVTRSKRPV